MHEDIIRKNENLYKNVAVFSLISFVKTDNGM